MNAARITWTFAKTFALTAPHEYVLQKDYPAYFAEFKEMINREGVDLPFTLFGNTKIYRYIWRDEYKYWIDEDVLNREPKK